MGGRRRVLWRHKRRHGSRHGTSGRWVPWPATKPATEPPATAGLRGPVAGGDDKEDPLLRWGSQVPARRRTCASPQQPPKALREDQATAALRTLMICITLLMSSTLPNLSLDADASGWGSTTAPPGSVYEFQANGTCRCWVHWEAHPPKAAINLASYESSCRLACCGSTQWSTYGRVAGVGRGVAGSAGGRGVGGTRGRWRRWAATTGRWRLALRQGCLRCSPR